MEGNSCKWKLFWRLTEVHFTSPFNIYETISNCIAKGEKLESASRSVRIPWSWYPSLSLPLEDTERASSNTFTEKMMFQDILLADDSIIIGAKNDMGSGKQVFTMIIERFRKVYILNKKPQMTFRKNQQLICSLLRQWTGKQI